MSRIRINREEADIRYTNWLAMLIQMIKPANLYLIGGRGVAKSTDIIAKRSIDIIYDMPRASFSFVSDTYVNLMTNIVPSVLLGWEREQFYEGIHYIVDKPPLPGWDLPYLKTFSYKHTISTFNGCKFFMHSLDRPSTNAGISTVHHFGDEAKYLKESKLSKLKPALRGDAHLYSHSHYFMGQTYCTDMPNPILGEDPWILEMEKNMDKDLMMLILKAAIILNDIELELYRAQENKAPESKLKTINRNKARWLKRIFKARQDSTFFYVVSSFANADILTLKYFTNLLESLTFEEFKTAVLSIKALLEKGAMFYGNMAARHFYTDGIDYDYYDKYGLRDNIKQTSAGLKYIRANELVEAGYDAGNMMSLVIGQSQGDTYRVLKNIYTLSPEWIRQLADKFLLFFETHKQKTLHLYYDRSAGAYRKAKQDLATKLKQAIEVDDKGSKTGWKVSLMSIGQGNITHQEEYDLMSELMGETNRRLPKLLIDQYNCKELKSSLELAPLTKDSKGQIKKDKRSEKLASHRLPLESTNMSDGFKYLMCRKNYLRLVKANRKINVGDVQIR